MASISTDKNGNRRILFVGPDRKRRCIRLGSIPIKAAEKVRDKVEALIASRITGTSWDNETAAWVRDLTPAMASKLARAGLTGPVEPPPAATTLGPFLRSYIDQRTDVKPNTRRNLEASRRYLVEFFTDGRALRSITGADADSFGFHMRGTYAEATAARVIKHARQFFTFARRGGLVDADPFAEVKVGSMTNTGRLSFIDRPTVEKLLEAAPDAEWRLIIALSRFGGLRTPSEHLALTWADVDWDRGRLLVRAPKTKDRWVPLFPELRPHLAAAFELAAPGAVYVIHRTRDARTNWRTMFQKIINRAGLLPWERLFQNLRASRETELAADYPLHVVTAWIGNSAPVAAKHYLSVTDEDFARAVGGLTGEAAQKAAQQPTAGGCNEVKPGTDDSRKRRHLPSVAAPCSPVQSEGIPLTGVEPVF